MTEPSERQSIPPWPPVKCRRRPRRLAYLLAVLFVAAFFFVGLIGWQVWSRISEPIWHRTVVPSGQRVTMPNGLSIVAPSSRNAKAWHDSIRWRAAWLYDGWDRECDEQLRVKLDGDPDWGGWDVAVASFHGDPRSSTTVKLGTDGRGLPPLAYSSRDGVASVYWLPDWPVLFVVTAVPGKQPGLVEVTIGSTSTASGVNLTLKRVWNELAIEGLRVPQLPTRR